MSRKTQDWNWTLNELADGEYSTKDAQLSVLMDIRDELKKLNRLLHCQNFQDIPAILRRVE